MDALEVVLFFLIPFFLFCLCGFCCRRKQRGIIFSNVDFPWGFVFFILIIILFSMLCTHCCRTERGAVYRTPVVVTSATHTAPGGYPTGVQTTTVYPTSSSGYQQTAYPQQAPYPAMGVPTAMPMPMQQAHMNPNPIGLNTQAQVMPPYPPNAAPYAPGANYNYSMNPPSYDSAVAPNQAAYEKQAPYNPGYTTGY